MMHTAEYLELKRMILALQSGTRRVSGGAAGGAPAAHATSHENGGTDEVDVATLGGFPGGTTTFLRADGTFAVPVDVLLGIVNGRLTTESGVAISTTERTAQSTIYFTPYLGNQIALYDGANWHLETFAELSLALSGLTSGKNYDVYVDYNGGTPQLALSAAWTNDTTRADALATQNGVLVKSGATDHRYVGTIRTTGTTTTEDSHGGVTTQVGGKRFVWNLYHRVPRPLRVIDTANTWTYTGNSWQIANGATGPLNCVEFVVGLSISHCGGR